jgi:hypothetical protein
MNPDQAFQQWTIAMQRIETIIIVSWVVAALLFLLFNGVVLYLTFGRVLIPLSRSLCNYLDAQAWHVDHQYKSRPGVEKGVIDKSGAESRYMPKS